jgi:hypothetical protein
VLVISPDVNNTIEPVDKPGADVIPLGKAVIADIVLLFGLIIAILFIS